MSKKRKTKILFPPGIGDIYWSLVKSQSFLKQKNLGVPDIYVACRPDKYNGHNRAFPFIEMFSFINSTRIVLNNNLTDEAFWTNAYTQTQTGIFKDVIGCDYFIAYNGPINAGIPLEEVDPELECNWNLSMSVSSIQNEFKTKMREQHGQYIVYHFGCRGTYEYWIEEFSIDQIISSIKLISEKTETTPILVGGLWDVEDAGLIRIILETGCINMLGRTTLEELFGMIHGSEMVIGFPSGLIMLAPVIGIKTLAMWSSLYPEATSWNVVAPYVRNSLYFVEKTKGLVVEYLINRIMEIK